MRARQDTAAARRFFRRLLKNTGAVPRVVATDKLRSYGASHREVMSSVEHRCHKGLDNRAENSHQPTRQQERAMKGFPVGWHRAAVPVRVQRHRSVASHLASGPRHLMTVHGYLAEMIIRFAIWGQITGAAGQPATAWTQTPTARPPCPDTPSGTCKFNNVTTLP